MILATTKVEDFDRFLKVYSTKEGDSSASAGCCRRPRNRTTVHINRQ
jgi:hypothetical protein